MTGNPFREAADEYLAAGWSPIPLPFKRKTPPPTGYTGYLGARADHRQVANWSRGRQNIALRMPEQVLGIDVDAYGAKVGGGTFAEAEVRLGALPPTWRSTSRADDVVSGIRFYRVPAGRQWADVLGPDVEIIHHGHRYAVGWPSVHPEGREYDWTDPDGLPAGIPNVADLPSLPDAWVTCLDRGSVEDRPASAELSESDAGAWLAELPAGAPCKAVEDALGALQDRLQDGGSRHDAGRHGVLALIRLGEQGHAGVRAALKIAHDAWVDALADGESRAPGRGEWERMVVGGVARVLGSPTAEADKGCCPDASSPADDFDALPADAEATGAGWLPVDLAAYADGTHQGPTTELMVRTDGVALLYRGMTHSLHGESESGKSMLAQGEVAERLKADEWVLYADYEADPGSVVERLLLMGVTPAQLQRLVYVQPEADPSHSASRAAFEALLTRDYSLAVIDGVNEALAQAPAKARSSAGLGGNDDITVWHDRLPRVIARRTGAAVVLIDHVAKGPDAGRFAIGGQAKMASISGAAYVVKPREPLGRNMVGEVDLYVGKDRHGHVRNNAGLYDAKSRLQLVATAIVDGTDGALSVELCPPQVQPTADDKRAEMMQRVSDYLSGSELPADLRAKGAPGKHIKDHVTGAPVPVARALDALVAQGYVRREQKGPGRPTLHWLVRPFLPEFEAEAIL